MRLFLTLAFLSMVFGLQARAQTIELGEILITAGRTPVEEKRSGRAATIIPAEKLEESQTRYVADALRHVPGLQVSRMGSFGGLTQVRIRGAEANHVLVLIDGVEVSETSDGAFDFGSLQVADIERIEVLRGPQSAFWGSDALGGVINIITKAGLRDRTEFTARSETGTDGAVLGALSMRGGAGRFDGAFSASYRQTQGFNISDFGSEKDGDENLTLNGKLAYDLTPDLQLTGTLRYVNRLSESDVQDFAFPATATQGLVIDSDDETATEEVFGSLTGVWDMPGGRISHKFGLQAGQTTRENFAGGARQSGTEGQRIKGFYQTTFSFKTSQLGDFEHKLTGGYAFERETFRQLPPVFSPAQLEEQSRNLHGIVAEYRGAFDDRLFLNAGLRHDFNERFEDATTFSLSGAYLLPQTDTRLHASIGTGVKNPNFYEQFGFDPGNFTGNPDLRPEHSLGWDIGVEQSFFDGRLVVDATYFEQNLQDEIETLFLPSFVFTVVNLDGRSRRRGVELSTAFTPFENFSAVANYTYTRATDPDGAPEVRRPEHTASLNISYSFYEGRARLFADVLYNGKTDDLEFISATPQTRVQLDDYVLVNIGGSFKVNDRFQIYGRVENVLDEDYEEVFGFNNQGLSAFVGGKLTLGGR